MTLHHQDPWLTVHVGDCRAVLAEMAPESVHCVVTSPPYWGLRDYGHGDQLGLEPTPEEYVANMVAVFREVRRVLRSDGTVWLNLGDSYAASSNTGGTGSIQGSAKRVGAMTSKGHGIPPNLKPKDLVGIPWRVAFALQADGWYLRSDIIWSKANPMPESVTDRPTKAHEYLFLLSKAERYYFDADAVREGFADERMGNPGGGKRNYAVGDRNDGDDSRMLNWSKGAEQGGRNIRSVWTIATQPYGSVKRQRVGPGEHGAADDSDRIASPDCPVHAGQGRPAPKASRDGQPAAFGSLRSPGTGRRRAATPQDELVPIALLPDADSDADSSGSPLPEYGDAATPRSTRSHRTDLDPETSPRETGDAPSSSRTGRTEPEPAADATSVHTPESSTAEGSAEGGMRQSSSAGTAESSSCTCTYWESVSHFAVFPPKLVEPCILAGTSARGVCPECGAPWERVVERERGPMPPERGGKNYGATAQGTSETSALRKTGGDDWYAYAGTTTTTGWRPTCDHGHCVTCDNEPNAERTNVPSVQTDVSPRPPRAADLLDRMREPIEGRTVEDRATVPGVRGVLRSDEATGDVLFPDLLERGDGTDQADHEGLRGQPQGLHPPVPAEAPDGDEDRLRGGAPTGDGGDAGPDAGAVGGRGSHQRHQERQPAGEPAGADEADARSHLQPGSGSDDDMPGVRAPLPSPGTCDQCGGQLTPLDPVPGVVLDVFGGSGTTAVVAQHHSRRAVLIDLNPEYIDQQLRRNVAVPLGLEVA